MIRPCLLVSLILAGPLYAQEQLRIATYNIGLGRDGPGLLFKDILDRDEDILAAAKIIGITAPDILLLTGFDNDYQTRALTAFNTLDGMDYQYIFAPLGNAGQDSGLDINDNDRLGDWNDAWGFGRFEGSEGMALLSNFPIANSRSFDLLKWQDFGPPPQAADGRPFFSHWLDLRLASHSIWDVEFTLPSGPLHILAAHPTPPVFDGEEDANGLRNAAEISFLNRYLSGEPFTDDTGTTASLPNMPVILLADLNADPILGDSRKPALRALLANPRLQLTNTLATTDWETAGRLRVDYALPDSRLSLLDSGVYWPEDERLLNAANTRHRLVWIDIALPIAP